MSDDRRLITNCTFCGHYFGEPPTGPVYDANTGEAFGEYWCAALDPDDYAGDYAKADVYHMDCWRALETLIRQAKNESLETFA